MTIGVVSLSGFMSSPCLSSVLTNANLAMYQTGLSDGVSAGGLPSIIPLQNSNLNGERPVWYQVWFLAVRVLVIHAVWEKLSDLIPL